MKRNAKILRPWFVACLLIFLIHQLSQKWSGLHVRLLDSYLDPLLLMPILLHLYLWERRLLFGKALSDVLPREVVFSFFLLIASLAEGLFPLLGDRFTADWLDVICYFAGSLLFLAFFNRPAQ